MLRGEGNDAEGLMKGNYLFGDIDVYANACTIPRSVPRTGDLRSVSLVTKVSKGFVHLH
jgi:hypothetical protein